MTTENLSGYVPQGRAVLVRLVQVPKKTEGGIALPDNSHAALQLSEKHGWVVGIGPDAWKDKSPRASVGDKVMFRKFAGETITGQDDLEYRVMDAEDIYARVLF